MSGGSYNYLYNKQPGELFQQLDDAVAMRDRLIELGYVDAAKETERLICKVRQFWAISEVAIERLSGVWKAIEWLDSYDSGPDAVADAIKIYRGED